MARTTRLLTCILAIAATCSFAFLAMGAANTNDGFVPLFNGKDLTGWKGDPRLWKAVDGAIVGSTDDTKIEHNSFLMTDKKYSDFILRAKVKLRNHNSGIQFRSEILDDYVAAGYQADMAEAEYFGMLYEERKRGILDYWKAMSKEKKDAIQKTVHQGDWNDYEIRCQGHHITLVLNGQVTCDLEDPTGATDGYIGLQLHAGKPMMVSFKDIMIKELKPSDGKKTSQAPSKSTAALTCSSKGG